MARPVPIERGYAVPLCGFLRHEGLKHCTINPTYQVSDINLGLGNSFLHASSPLLEYTLAVIKQRRVSVADQLQLRSYIPSRFGFHSLLVQMV